jgi:hypothetical protein
MNGRPGARSRGWLAKFAASRVANVRTWREGLRSPRIQKCTASGVAPRLSAITATVSRSRLECSQARNSSTVIVGVRKWVAGATKEILTLFCTILCTSKRRRPFAVRVLSQDAPPQRRNAHRNARRYRGEAQRAIGTLSAPQFAPKSRNTRLPLLSAPHVGSQSMHRLTSLSTERQFVSQFVS